MLKDKDGEVISSSEDKNTLQEKKTDEQDIEIRNYDGCPAFSFDNTDDLL